MPARYASFAQEWASKGHPPLVVMPLTKIEHHEQRPRATEMSVDDKKTWRKIPRGLSVGSSEKALALDSLWWALIAFD